MSKDYWDKKVEVDTMVAGHTLSKKQAEKARRAKIIEEAGSTPASELYTDEQWARLMWAGHSEVAEIHREIDLENAKEGKGLLGMLQPTFEEWFNSHEQWLIEYAAETGADRELDFNVEEFEQRMYEEYLNDR